MATQVRFYAALGEFVFEFSRLRVTIRHFLGMALDLGEDRFRTSFSHTTSPLSARSELQVWLTTPGLSKKELAKVKRYFDLICAELNTERNRIVHGTWFISARRAGARHVARNTLKAGFSSRNLKPSEGRSEGGDAALRDGAVRSPPTGRCPEEDRGRLTRAFVASIASRGMPEIKRSAPPRQPRSRRQKGGLPDHDEARARHDLLHMRVLEIPSLDLVFGWLAGLHAGIETQSLDDERAVLGEMPKPLSFRASMRWMRLRTLEAEARARYRTRHRPARRFEMRAWRCSW